MGSASVGVSNVMPVVAAWAGVDTAVTTWPLLVWTRTVARLAAASTSATRENFGIAITFRLGAARRAQPPAARAGLVRAPTRVVFRQSGRLKHRICRPFLTDESVNGRTKGARRRPSQNQDLVLLRDSDE